MAFDAGSLLSFLRLDTKGFSTGLATAKGKVNQFDSSIAKSDKTLKGMSGTAAGLGKLMLTGLGFLFAIKAVTGFAKAVGDSIGAASDLEKSMANVATLVDTSTVNIDELTESVLEMSTEVLKSAGDLSAGLYQVFSAGVTDSSEAMEVLRVSAIAATAGLSDTATSVDAITTILNAYGLAANRATDVSDLLFQTVKLGKTTFTELANAIGTVISPAASLGIELDELFAVLATLTKGGIDTRTATTALRALFLSILKPTDQAKKKARELGIEWNVQSLRAKQLVAFLGELREKTKGNVEDITELVPNVRALNGVLATVGEQWESLINTQDEFEDRAGATIQALGKQADTAKSQSERLGLAIDKLSTKFGGLFLSIKKVTVSGLADFFEETNSIIEKLITGPLTRAEKAINNLFEGRRISRTGIDLMIAKVEGFISALKTADIDLVQFFSKTISEQQRLIQALGLPEILIPKELKLGVESLVKETKKASEEIIKTWKNTSDSIKEAFSDLGIVPEFQFEQVVQDTLASFETVSQELDNRGDLTVEKAAKIRQALIDKLKELSAEAAESGFIIDEDKVARVEQLLNELGDSALRTSSKVLIDTEKLADATTVTIEKGVFDVNRFITETATESINSFKDVGLNITSVLVDDFNDMANAHVEAWKSAIVLLQEEDIKYTSFFQSELDKREDGFDEFTRNLKAKAIATANSINQLLSGTATPSITVPVFDRGTLSVPQTGIAQVEEGEMIIPAAENPFNPANDNRTFNIDMSSSQSIDEFEQERRLLNVLQIASENRL